MLHFRRPSATTVQWGIVFLGFAAFVVTAQLFSAPMYWPLVGTAVPFWCALAAIAYRMGPSKRGGYYEACILMFVSSIPVVTALVTTAGATFDILIVIPFALALWLGQALWGLLRFPTLRDAMSNKRRTWWANALWGLAWGTTAAVIYSIIVAILFALHDLRGMESRFDDRMLPAIVASYFAGFLGAGLIVGLLRPLARFPLGAMVLGCLGAFCVYGAVGVVVLGFPLTSEHFFMGLGIALFVGPGVGLGVRADPL